MKTLARLLPVALVGCLAPSPDKEVVPAGPGSLVINEAVWSSLRLDGTTDPHDWVELYNPTSDRIVDAAGCVLTDGGKDHRLQIPAGTFVQPHAFLLLEKADTPDEAGGLRYAFGFSHDETVRLLDARGDMLDSVSLEGRPAGKSVGRFPDGAGSPQPLLDVTPGAANLPATSGCPSALGP